MSLIMILCIGVLVCALTPSLTEMLAEKVENLTSSQAGGNDHAGGDLSFEEEQTPAVIGGREEVPEQPDGIGGEKIPGLAGMTDGQGGADRNSPEVGSNGEQGGIAQPGINADWIRDGDQVGYEPPDSQAIKTPASVSGRTGYEPVQDEGEQILPEEADNLTDSAGNIGSELSFDAEFYPYYAMLETDMQALYSQIYANAMDMVQSFAPVAEVNVNQLKTVFEAVYNDHPELFWLETGYYCKYLRDGRCVEITLKYNETAENLEQTRGEFEGRAEEILAGARALGSETEKEQYVHDRLMQSVEYVINAPMNQSAYSALVKGQSVCAGYARAFQYLMQQLGIPCYYCTGFAGEDHAWNIIKLGGGYHNVDVTWDDTEPSTYDYFNRSDRQFGMTHMRTGLAVYLPACVSDREGFSDQNNDSSSGAGENGDTPDTGDGQETEDVQGGMAELINPTPMEPLTWKSKTGADLDVEMSEEEKRQEALETAGITEEDIRATIKEYYEDCGKLLQEAGIGDKQFINVIPEDLWNSVEQAYNSGEYWKGYVEGALKEMGAESFVINLQAQSLGGGYYRLYHNVYTY